MTRNGQNMKTLGNCKMRTSYKNMPIHDTSFASLLNYMGLIIYVNTVCRIKNKLEDIDTP